MSYWYNTFISFQSNTSEFILFFFLSVFVTGHVEKTVKSTYREANKSWTKTPGDNIIPNSSCSGSALYLSFLRFLIIPGTCPLLLLPIELSWLIVFAIRTVLTDAAMKENPVHCHDMSLPYSLLQQYWNVTTTLDPCTIFLYLPAETRRQ